MFRYVKACVLELVLWVILYTSIVAVCHKPIVIKDVIIIMLQEMQLVVLKYREELIAAKVGQEHNEELLKSEIMFLRDQVVAEQQERSTMEENLAQEISQLQQQLGNWYYQ